MFGILKKAISDLFNPTKKIHMTEEQANTYLHSIQRMMERDNLDSDIKMVIIVRKDLKIPTGKFGVQTAHAAIAAMDLAWPEHVWGWRENNGEKKVVLECCDLDHLFTIASELEEENIPYTEIEDAAFTVFDKPVITCIGIPPLPSAIVDKVTSRLRLYS